MKVHCHHCNAEVDLLTGHINRAKKLGKNIYCNRICSGLGRRKNLTKEQKIQQKSDYDAKYRKEQADALKLRKAEYHKKSYDPQKAAIARKARMPYHVEYCRKPEYQAKKAEYDKRHLSQKKYGEFWESALILNDLERKINNSINS